MKVVCVHSVFQSWRYNYYPRFSNALGGKVIVVHGPGVPRTKMMNAPDNGEVRRVELNQWVLFSSLTGRRAPLLYFPRLWATLNSLRPDVLLVEGGSNLLNSIATVLWGKVNRVPVVWWTLGELAGRKYTFVGKAMRWVVGAVERRCDAMLLYSSAALAYARRQGICQGRCFVAVNVVDTERIWSRRSEWAPIARDRRQQLFNGRRVLVASGALVEGKSMELLPEVLRRVRMQHGEVAMLIIGDGPLRGALEAEFTSVGLRDSVHFAGHQQRDQISEWMGCGDVGILPGLGGLAISEMMAHGLPVVCNGGDGTERDLIQEGVTGFNVGGKCGREAIDGIVSSILRTIACPERCKAMGEAAQNLVLSTYSGSSMVRAMVEAVRSVNERVNA